VVFLNDFFTVLTSSSQIFANTREVGAHTVSGISAAVGVPADAITVLSVPTVAGILAVAGLISAVYVCDVPIRVSAAVHPTVANVIG
jgi:hypothetical protein